MVRALFAFLIAVGSGLPVLALAADVDGAGNPLPARTVTAGPSSQPNTVGLTSEDPSTVSAAGTATPPPAAKPAAASRSNWKKLLPGNIK